MGQTERGSTHCPVIDFDHESGEHAAHWPERLQAMRDECPRAWTANHGGFWIATKYKDVVKIAKSGEDFTTTKTVDPVTRTATGGISIPPTPNPRQVPLEVENGEWRAYRDFLNPYFGPKAAETLRPRAEKIARTLIDHVIETGRMDVVEDLTSPLPALFTMSLLGLELDGWREFADPVHRFTFVKRGEPAFQTVLAQIDGIVARLKAELDLRRTRPGDDMLSVLANGVVNGTRLTEAECIEIAIIIVFGGVDTTTALASNALRHLALYPEQRRRLIEDRSILPCAREEFLRYFTPVQGPARSAARDVEMDGWRFAAGDRVMLSYASANRDEEVFQNAAEVVIDRFPNRHIGFGSGMHRCLGSFHARVMFDTMINEVLDRLPDFALEDGAEPYPSVRMVNGWSCIPVSFTPGRRLGGGIDLNRTKA